MYKMIRFFNQNRKSIYKVILIIVFIIGIIQLLNGFAKIKYNSANSYNMTNNNNNVNNNYNKALLSDKSAISGEQIQDSKLSSQTEVIENFIKDCNEEKLEDAYGLITDECKEEMFFTIDDFNEIYYKPLFNGKNKIYTIENWIDNIYKVKISDNILATGKYTNQSSTVEYIAVDSTNDNDYKLNINGYLGRQYLNKEEIHEDIGIKVLQEDRYMDYTSYLFEITNNSKNNILLDDLNDIDTMYLEDNNNLKYSAYTHELVKEELKVKELEKKQVKIKYYNKYGTNKKINKIVFNRLILNYGEYVDSQNKNQTESYYTFKIEL